MDYKICLVFLYTIQVSLQTSTLEAVRDEQKDPILTKRNIANRFDSIFPDTNENSEQIGGRKISTEQSDGILKYIFLPQGFCDAFLSGLSVEPSTNNSSDLLTALHAATNVFTSPGVTGVSDQCLNIDKLTPLRNALPTWHYQVCWGLGFYRLAIGSKVLMSILV